MVSDVWADWRASHAPVVVDASRQRSGWRMQAAQVCAEVVAAYVGSDERELRAALREAYPFGMRRMWPYKCWLIEQNAAIQAWLRHRPMARER